MKNKFNLNGRWELIGRDDNGNNFCLPATVPGCVHTDLIDNGIIKDIYFRDNNLKYQWIEQGDFSYKREFYCDEVSKDAYLVFGGLDTYCDVYLNEIKLGAADNMHLTYEFCVDGILKQGNNEIKVCFRSPIKEVQGREALEGCFTTERLYTRRIQCTYGWDWVDRFVTMGIWRDVTLVFKSENEIESYYIYTKDINPLSAQMSLNVNIGRLKPCKDKLKIQIFSPNGECVFLKNRALICGTIKEKIDIDTPMLWYPNGYGAQPLYTLSLTIGEQVCESRFGIRKISIVELVDKEGSEYRKKSIELKKKPHLQEHDFNTESSGFIVLVNDVKIMCKGANWVPCEPFPSAETPEKIKKLLNLGAMAGLNFLRVWGGGVFEQDAFYDECDRLGILVAQDFLMACGKYPAHLPEFREALKKETAEAAYKLRNRTCLAWWHGDNENAANEDENKTDYPAYVLSIKCIEPVLSELDPSRVFLPSSPYGGVPFASAVRGTTHNSEFMGDFFRYVWANDIESHTEFMSQYLNRFCSEQPTMGMPFISSLKKFLDDEDIYGEDMSMLEFHTKNNPDFGDITLHDYCNALCEKIFGKYKDGTDRIHKLQMLQCEWIRISFELFRRNKWFSSGIIFWMFNDCWPAATGWSIVDYYGCPKPAYYSFARCAKPVLSSIEKQKGSFYVHISNDALQKVSGNGRLYLYDYEKKADIWETEFSFQVEENKAAVVCCADAAEIESKMTETTVLLCDIVSENGNDRSYYVPLCFHNQKLFDANLQILEQTEEYILVTADEFVPIAIFDTPYVLEENCFPLKGGEKRKIKICHTPAF